MTKKLYEVRVEYVGYVLAESEYAAQYLASYIADDLNLSEHAEALEVAPSSPVNGGWDLECLVYQSDHGSSKNKEMTLGEAWPKAPTADPPPPPALFPNQPLLPATPQSE